MRIINLYLEHNKLDEANLKKLFTKSINETPKMAQKGEQLSGSVRYFGLSKDGTLNFKVKSQSVPGGYYYVYIEAPDIIRLSDVVEEGDHINEADLNRLLTMDGFRVHCFTAGHKVITKDGEKNIEDIKVGDFVLTHKGNFKEVYDTQIHNYSGDLIKINGNILVTPEHKFFTKDKDGTCRWKEAQFLSTSDTLVTPLEPIGYIYKTTDISNNKVYIGQKRSPEFNPNYHGSGRIISNIILKDSERLKTELIEFCASSDLLDEREKYWISFYNSTNRNVGYNISPGGNNSISVIGCKRITKDNINKAVPESELEEYLSDGWSLGYSKERNMKVGIATSIAMQDYNPTKEQRYKMGSANRGKHLKDETKKKISEHNKLFFKEHQHHLKGVPKSEEWKKMMSNKMKGRKRDSKGHFIKGGDVYEQEYK